MPTVAPAATVRSMFDSDWLADVAGRAGKHLGTQDLERDPAIEIGIARREHHAHATGAERAGDLEATVVSGLRRVAVVPGPRRV